MTSLEETARAGDWHAVALELGCLPQVRNSGYTIDMNAKARFLDRASTPSAGYTTLTLHGGVLFAIQREGDTSLAMRVWSAGERRGVHVGFLHLNYDATQCNTGEWCPVAEHRMHCESWLNGEDYDEDYDNCEGCDRYHSCSSCENERPLCATHGVAHNAIYIYS